MGIFDHLISKNKESEVRRLAREQGIALRDLTREELSLIDFGRFSYNLVDSGAMSKHYALVYNLTEVHPNGKDSNSINYINLVFKSFTDPNDIKVNIKSLNVSTAKGDSNVYQYNKKMSQVWIDMCYEVLLSQNANSQQGINNDDEKTEDGMELNND